MITCMCRVDNVLDFDSLHLLVNQLLDIEAPRLELQQRFLHILVDEYQDTNIPQVIELTTLPFSYFTTTSPL